MDLNEDCLNLIFNQLNIYDQIAVAKTCHRFHTVMMNLWQRKYNDFKDYNDYQLNRVTYKDFSVLIKCISNTVTTMDFHELTLERFQILKLYVFPNLISFKFCAGYPCRLKDNHILEMTKMFPRLQIFEPDGEFSGMHIERFRHLRHLNLFSCNKKKFICLEKIFERSNLISIYLNVFRRYHTWTSRRAFKNFCSLEAITVNCYELKWLADITKFKNLKMLTLQDRDKSGPFENILLKIYKDIRMTLVELDTTVIFPFDESLSGPMNTYDNLRRLVIRDQDIYEFKDIYLTAPNLREILFWECKIFEAADLLLFFDNNHLELLSLEDCICGFREFRLDVEAIAQHRTNEFQINFHQNTFAESYDEFFIPFMSHIPVKLTIEGIDALVKTTDVNMIPHNFFIVQVKF